MSERHPWSEIIGQVVGAVMATFAVTAASFIWRLPQAHRPQAVLAVYGVSAILMLAGGFIVFRRVVRHGYRRRRRLTPFPFFLQLLIWGVFFAFPCIYNPFDWAWSWPSLDRVTPVLLGAGWGCVGVGVVILIIAMARLGLSRSIGQESGKLEISGPYHITRNPQFTGGVLLVFGYVLLWPSWYALGWLFLFAVLMHMMILTEEEHLHRIHGEDYEQYCKRVPRYLGFPRRM